MPWSTCFVDLIGTLLCFQQLPPEPLRPSTILGPPRRHGAALPATTQPIDVTVSDKHASERATHRPTARITLTTLPQEIRDIIYDFINEDQMVVWIVPFLTLLKKHPAGNFKWHRQLSKAEVEAVLLML